MRRTVPPELPHLEILLSTGVSALPPEESAAQLAALRTSPELAALVDRAVIDRLRVQQQGLVASRTKLKEAEAILTKLTAAPHFLATYIAIVATAGGHRALVRQGGGERLVNFGDQLDPQSLIVGDLVYLNSELNVALGRAPDLPRRSETCLFERKTPDGRFLVKHRDEQWIALPPPALASAELKPGDLLGWHRDAMLVTEKVERTSSTHLFLEQTPRETFADIGGLEHEIAQIKRALQPQWKRPELAREYGTQLKRSVLLYGPSGNGKTLLAKALANWLANLSPSGRAVFMNIKPGELHSVWYSQSEANYREAFRTAREAAQANGGQACVMFFDELDSCGLQRGQSNHMRVHDNVLTTLITELDGLTERGHVFVVGATNRREALDPALVRPGRMGDLMLEIPRPNRRAARQILAHHLAPTIPYARNGHGDDAEATREEILDCAVSRIYAPNGENELATLTFRDGKRRPVRASDLASGAVLANVARTAVERAYYRDVESDVRGLSWSDVAEAINGEFTTAARGLTPTNCRQHLSGLPHDLDVVNVEPVARKVAAPHRFLNAA